jgi:hypothetical protein
MPKLAHYFVSPHDHDLHSGCRKFSHDVAVPLDGKSLREVHANEP